MTNNCRQSPYQNSTRRQLNATLFAVRLGNRRRRRPNRNKNIERNTRKTVIPYLENFSGRKTLFPTNAMKFETKLTKSNYHDSRELPTKKTMRPIRVRHARKDSGRRVQGRMHTKIATSSICTPSTASTSATGGVPCEREKTGEK